MMAKILVIDDEKPIRKTLCEILSFEKYLVEEAEDGQSGVKKCENEDFDLVLCDIKMPKMDGLEVLEKLKALDPSPAVVMISGHGTIDTAVDALKKGAFDYLQKPPDLNRLLVTVRNAMERSELVSETKSLKKKLAKVQSNRIVGESTPIKSLLEMVTKVAPTDARVLITGGNGSGKELVARAIHEQSHRAKSPMVEVNCAAIPSELIESELFGHEKGAFTSAIKQRQGKFEQANGGSLFLDEIGDMSLSAQAKVLRALQENKISRVGGDKEIKVDVRVLAATNKDLKAAIAAGDFREDLYHRLSVVVINNPSLNERKEDIPLLAEHFIKQVCEEHGVKIKTIDGQAIKALQGFNWTGNIREFRNVIERLVIFSGAEIGKTEIEKYANPLSS